MPQIRRPGFHAAAGWLSLTAVISKPGARVAILSPWLIHELNPDGTPSNRGLPGVRVKATRPYSLTGRLSTRPPLRWVMSWNP